MCMCVCIRIKYNFVIFPCFGILNWRFRAKQKWETLGKQLLITNYYKMFTTYFRSIWLIKRKGYLHLYFPRMVNPVSPKVSFLKSSFAALQ